VISGFHHFSIACSDADRSSAFYRDVFGMEPISDRDVPAGGFVEKVTGVRGAHVRIVHLRGYGFNFELLEYRAPRGDERAREPNHTGSAHLCFTTEDLDAEYERLVGLGVRFRSPGPVTVVGGPNDGGKALYLEDPDGNPVEVVELARAWPGERAGAG
jgi:catechol 2,3-dioxygenase-like lactoylglutathione lyase family enzyme